MTSSHNVPQLSHAAAELAGLRLRDHTMKSAMQEVADVAKATVPGADEVSVTLINATRANTLVHTGEMALRLDESQYERGYGPCLDAARLGTVMHIDDLTTESRWGDYTKEAAEHGALSSVSMPLVVHEERRVCAAMNVYSTSAHAFDDENLRTATTLTRSAESMLANMHEHDQSRQLVQQLAEALDTRPVIDQAKGILMRDRGCTAGAAFDLLVSASQRSNRKLRLVAQDVVNSVAHSWPPDADGPTGRRDA